MTASTIAVAPGSVSHGLLLESGGTPTPFPVTGDEKRQTHQDAERSPLGSRRELPLQWYVGRLRKSGRLPASKRPVLQHRVGTHVADGLVIREEFAEARDGFEVPEVVEEPR